MNMPQGYKQTELGIIPEDWEVKSFSQIFDMYPNNTYPRDCMNDSRGVVRNIHYGDVLIKYPTIVDVEKCAIPYLNEGVKIKLQKLVQSGDIIIADTAEDETVGKCVEIKNVGDNKIVAGLHTFFCRPTAPFAAGWLGYYINSTNYHNQLIPYITGIKVSSISRTSIQETKLLVPPIAEQRAIAEALSDVDGLIAALDTKIAKKRLLKQGAMQQLLTGKKRLPGFTDKWIDRSLSQLGSFISGNGFPIYFQGNKSGKYPFFKVSDFNNRGNERCLMHSNNYISESTKERLNCNIVPVSSVIFAKIGAAIFLERKRLSTKECCIDNNMMAFSPNEYIDANYICFLLQTISFGELVEATALPSLGAKILGSIILKVPNTLNEQQAIATILSDMDKEIADLETQRDKYRLLKSGMMQKLLTGQIRLVKQQAKIVPLGVDVPAVRKIPVAAHIIAGHIVNRSHKSRGWGRTKLQKSLHLIGYCMQLNLGTEYIRNTAGPDDQQLMNHIDQKFRQYRHVNKVCEKLPDGRTHYSYTPTPMIQDVEMAYEKYPKELREQIDALIDKLNTMDLAGAEILSTLYAVWNNRIIKQEQITDDLLIADFYAWSTHKADFEETRVRKALNYQKMIGELTAEQFEAWAKQEFIDHPGDMKLLIVVDKLLTGFDAPSATYLYIDKKMRDHNLFQAICRVNRVDSEEKDYGYIVDYQDLFGAVKSAIEDYTNGAFDGYDADDIKGLLTNRLAEARKALEEALQAVHTMCEVIHPQTREAYFAYFVYAETTPIEEQQKECEANANKRETFYKLVSRLVRRYIDLANEMEAAGFTVEEKADIKKQVDYYNDIKDEIKLKSGDALDLKYYDPAMRQLIDNYVRAEDSEKLVDLADISFLDLIDTDSDKAIDSLPKKIKQNERSVAEVLAANMRKMIISERPNNPAYFDKMSELLNQLLQEQKDGKLQYKELIGKLIDKLKEARSTVKAKYPAPIDTKGKQSLYDNLGNDEALTLRVHDTIKANARDGFRDMDGSGMKKMRALRRAVEGVLQDFEADKIDDIMQIIVAQKEY